MIQITMVDLERLVCRMTRYKQESAKYRKIVAVVLILSAVLAAVWLAERWYTRHKTSVAAAGVNPIGQLLTGQPDPAEPYTGTISLVVAGYDRSAEDGEEEIGLTDMILYLQWDCDRNKLEVLQVPPSLYVGWSTGQAEAGEGEENAANPTGQGSTTGRINAVARETGGLQGLCDEITAMTGLPVDGYLGMDLNGLGDIVEYIGGVEVDIPQEIENGGSYLPKGRYLLDRSSVEFLVRERRSYAYGDMDRQRAQRVCRIAAVCPKLYPGGCRKAGAGHYALYADQFGYGYPDATCRQRGEPAGRTGGVYHPQCLRGADEQRRRDRVGPRDYGAAAAGALWAGL